jgi:hypothetical protein
MEAIMAKKATTDKQSLELIMWDCHNALREKTGGNEKNCNAVIDTWCSSNSAETNSTTAVKKDF